MSNTHADFFAVIGNPIAHSKSPLIHAAFARQCAIDLRYEAVLAPIDGFNETIHALRAQGLRGCNVTVPFKLAAFDYVAVAQLSEVARWAGAVNTLHFDGAQVWGHNTDGVGLVRDIQHNCGYAFAGRRVAILGAGGAVRGALAAIVPELPASVVLINRTLSKAQAVVDDDVVGGTCARLGVSLAARAWAANDVQTFDVVINATSTGLSDDFVPPAGVSVTAQTLAYDMMYGKTTGFMRWMAEKNARVVDGWGMLVEQAASSFEVWHGLRPDTSDLIKQRGV